MNRQSEQCGSVIGRAAVNMKLFSNVVAKQLHGHITRKDSIENLAMTGKIDGKNKGKRRVLYGCQAD